MKILTFNCRGVVSPGKIITFHRLVESTQPDILLLQETLGDSIQVVPLLEKSAKVGTLLAWTIEVAHGDSQLDGAQYL